MIKLNIQRYNTGAMENSMREKPECKELECEKPEAADSIRRRG